MQKADAKTDQTMEEQTGDVPAAVVCVSTTTSDQVEVWMVIRGVNSLLVG